MSIDWDAVIAELRKPGGWMKGGIGDYDRDSGPVCLRGAICRVTRDADFDEVVRSQNATVEPILRAQFSDRLGRFSEENTTVPAFNDHPDTTLDDVIAVVEKARAAEQVQP